MSSYEEDMILLENSDEGHPKEGPLRRRFFVTCSCPSCGLYRWYPPLLVASTLMAGVFCALYLTTPQRMAAPAEGLRQPWIEQNPGIPLIEVDVPESRSLVVDVPSGTLDPMLAGLPGIVADDASLEIATRPDARDNVARRPGMKRLEIPKPARKLFEPASPPMELTNTSETPLATPIKVQRSDKSQEVGLAFSVASPGGHQSVLLVDLWVQEARSLGELGGLVNCSPIEAKPFLFVEAGAENGVLRTRNTALARTASSMIGEFIPTSARASDQNLKALRPEPNS